MNSLRKMLRVLATMLLVAFALPAVAHSDDEKFKVVLSPLALSSPAEQSVTATITNVSDDDDRLKSFKITAPANVTVSSTVTSVPTIPAANISVGGGVIAVKGLSVRSGQSVALTLRVTYPSSATCGTAPFTWAAQAWEGSNFSDDRFRLDSSSKLTQTLSAVCTLSFVNQPKNAVAGLNITSAAYSPTGPGVTVQLSVNSAASSSSTTPVTLTSSCLASPVTAISSNGVATFGPLPSNSVGGKNCTLAATATNHTSGTSAPFDLFVPSLTFLNQPSDALQGVVITDKPFNSPQGSYVQVQLKLDNVAPPTGFPTTPITIGSNCSSINGNTATTSVLDGKATFSALNIATPTQGCTLSAAALGKQTGPSNPFAIAPFVPSGQLNCNQAVPTNVANPTSAAPNEPGYAQGTRALFNGKGDPCALVNYSFTNLIQTDNTIINKWDTVTQPNAAFLYSVNWKAKLLVGGYPTVVRPKVAWEFDSTGAPKNITEGLACLSPSLPRPYGRLTAPLAQGGTSVTLDTSNPPNGGWEPLPAVGTPFPIYIDSERMTATVSSGTTLSLVRGQAGTSDAPHLPGTSDNTNDKYAMSTPLPIDTRSTSPYVGRAVRMCIVSHGWQAFSPDPVTGAARYFEVTDAIDNGDGWMAVD